MRHCNEVNILEKEDIQIQIPASRLGFIITLASGILLEDVQIRARLVRNSGTDTIIERMTAQTLFEIAARTEGFYRAFPEANGAVRYVGHVEIAQGGALELNNSTYISVDVSGPKTGPDTGLAALQVFSLQHAKTSTTYLHYNTVTINQALQGVQLEKAIGFVIPISRVKELQLFYPTSNVTHTNAELRMYADMANDIVSVTQAVGSASNVVTYGYENVIILPVRDDLLKQDATRAVVTAEQVGSSFPIYLIEEKSL